MRAQPSRNSVLQMVDSRTRVLYLVRLDVVQPHRYSGRYPALCGIDVLAADLGAGETSRCIPCRSQLAASPDRSGDDRSPTKSPTHLQPFRTLLISVKQRTPW